ncbi:MAG TPA: hypothetical protein VHO03_17085 [Ignavibacteriales bacterium]|nr:hypothetical protein [Ignavibacteriales bacterium]
MEINTVEERQEKLGLLAAKVVEVYDQLERARESYRKQGLSQEKSRSCLSWYERLGDSYIAEMAALRGLFNPGRN